MYSQAHAIHTHTHTHKHSHAKCRALHAMKKERGANDKDHRNDEKQITERARVFDQNGVSRLYITEEIYHSGRKLLTWKNKGKKQPTIKTPTETEKERERSDVREKGDRERR